MKKPLASFDERDGDWYATTFGRGGGSGSRGGGATSSARSVEIARSIGMAGTIESAGGGASSLDAGTQATTVNDATSDTERVTLDRRASAPDRDAPVARITRAAEDSAMARVPDSLGASFRGFVRAREAEADPLYRFLDEHLVIERAGWAPEIAARAAARINAVRAPSPPLEPIVFWFRLAMAFTTDGAYVYLTRRLVERLRFEDSVAFVVAHEMAHHDLGHVAARGRFTDGLLDRALVLARQLARSETRERDADDRALELCERAGYDRARCLQAFDAMLEASLDHRDLDGTFGEDDEIDGRDDERDIFTRLAKIVRRRSHPPLVARRERLRAKAPAPNDEARS